ncbi:hypothetical protein [Halobiforma nitratireducens]|uniref:hypothetical protein n=1 Tax=Halobiforma nitratireducens TaxID=130048 RepID=UPI000677C0E8|nr:hypothetical protein [Halobiforma nitratireducens]
MPSPTRRTVVAGCCTVALAGCLRDDEPEAGTGSESTDDTDDADDSPNDVSEPSYRTLEDERERGRAETISATKSEWDRWVEYQPDDDAVRYVASKGPSSDVDPDEYDQEPPDRDLEFTTTPWDRWKHIRANDVAGKAAVEVVTEALDVDSVSRPIAVGREPANRRTVVRVETVVDGDGNIIDGEPIDIDELAAVTPESVDVTYKLDERTYETTRAVFAEYRKTRLE